MLLGTDTDPAAIEPTTTVTDILRRLRSLVNTEPETDMPPLASSLTSAAMVEEHRQVATLLRQLAPVLVGVDGFRPSPSLGSWLASDMVPRVRSSEGVAILVTDRDEALRSLKNSADLFLTLGPLSPQEVREHLIKAATNLSPGLTTQELDRYVDSAVAQPAVLSALLAVFGTYGRAHVETST